MLNIYTTKKVGFILFKTSLMRWIEWVKVWDLIECIPSPPSTIYDRLDELGISIGTSLLDALFPDYFDKKQLEALKLSNFQIYATDEYKRRIKAFLNYLLSK